MSPEQEGSQRAVRVRSALEPVAMSLKADGYGLQVHTDGMTIHIAIAAFPDACEECLVPKPLMKSIITSTLEGAGLTGSIELVYPNEADAQDATT